MQVDEREFWSAVQNFTRKEVMSSKRYFEVSYYHNGRLLGVRRELLTRGRITSTTYMIFPYVLFPER